MRTVSQNAYRKLKRCVREDARAMIDARRKCLQAKREGCGRMRREDLSWKYSDWKRALAQSRAQLAECQPSAEKYPDWSPAARARNPHLTN
jgi:hypothetical protein